MTVPTMVAITAIRPSTRPQKKLSAVFALANGRVMDQHLRPSRCSTDCTSMILAVSSLVGLLFADWDSIKDLSQQAA